MFRWIVFGLPAVAGCGGEPAPAGYERWSGSPPSSRRALDRGERIDVPGATEAMRREVTFEEGAITIVFASHEAESHVALAVAGGRDGRPILESFALD